MKKHKPQLNQVEHESLGFNLFLMHKQIALLLEDVEDKYGEASRVTKHVSKLYDDMHSLRCELDNLAQRELGKEFKPTIYFPGADVGALEVHDLTLP